MRSLSSVEIEQMEASGCRAEDWTTITVDDDFNPMAYHHVSLRGKCHLGTCRGMHQARSFSAKPSGVSHVLLDNCRVGRNVLIEHVADAIQGYCIGNGVTIAHIAQLKADGGTTFGIGAPVSVLDETGGRMVMLSRSLSAQLAYIIAFSKHDAELQRRIESLVTQEAQLVSEQGAFVADGVELLHGGFFQNVSIGSNTSVVGHVSLKNGMIGNFVQIEGNTFADTFIIDNGTVVHGATLEHTFVGEGCLLSGGFYAHDTLIFANCTLANGEASAAFLAPHTVSMHRSTLLIGGLFSFFNAGSGTNQSNHHYRLGPMHYGILERGVKFASGAYILWSAHVGAFSKVVGRVYSHPNTEYFPFSVLEGYGEDTFLSPGATLTQVGTWRDLFKWGRRDRRTPQSACQCLDLIDYRWAQPAFLQACLEGWNLLSTLSRDELKQRYRVNIPDEKKADGIAFYQHILTLALALSPHAIKDLVADLHSSERYIDLVGVSIALSEYHNWVKEEKNIPSSSMNELKERLHSHLKRADGAPKELFARILLLLYPEYKMLGEREAQDNLIERALESTHFLEKLILNDAAREFKIHRGDTVGLLASNFEEVEADFRALRGDMTEHAFVVELRQYFEGLRKELIVRQRS